MRDERHDDPLTLPGGVCKSAQLMPCKVTRCVLRADSSWESVGGSNHDQCPCSVPILMPLRRDHRASVLTIPSVQTYAGGNLLSQEVIFSHEVRVTQPEFLVYRAYDIRQSLFEGVWTIAQWKASQIAGDSRIVTHERLQRGTYFPILSHQWPTWQRRWTVCAAALALAGAPRRVTYGPSARWRAGGAQGRGPNAYDTASCRAPTRGEPYEAATAAKGNCALPWAVSSRTAYHAVHHQDALGTGHDDGYHGVRRSACTPPRGKWTRRLAGDRSPHDGTGGRRYCPRPLHIHLGSQGNTRRCADLYVAGTDHIRSCSSTQPGFPSTPPSSGNCTHTGNSATLSLSIGIAPRMTAPGTSWLPLRGTLWSSQGLITGANPSVSPWTSSCPWVLLDPRSHQYQPQLRRRLPVLPWSHSRPPGLCRSRRSTIISGCTPCSTTGSRLLSSSIREPRTRSSPPTPRSG